MISKHSIIFIGIFTLLLLFSNISYVNNLDAFAQNSTGSSLASPIPKNIGGLKITSPEKGSVVPINSNSPFIIKGISNDNPASNCKVSIIINGIKPYQPVQPMNTAGKGDYTTWQYILLKNYTHLVVGSNKITAKSSCLNSPQNIFNSINVTGINSSPSLTNHSLNTISKTPSPLLTNHSLNTISKTPSPLLTNSHPIAKEIQKIKESSPIGNATTQNFQSVTPAIANTTSQSSKIITPPAIANTTSQSSKIITPPAIANTTSQSTNHSIKHTTTTGDHTAKPTHHVKHIHHIKHVAKPIKHVAKPIKHVKHIHHIKHVAKPIKHVKHIKHIVKHNNKKMKDNGNDNRDNNKKMKDNGNDNRDNNKKMKDNGNDNRDNNKKMKDNGNDNRDNNRGEKPRDLSSSILDQVRHNLASAGIDFG
jgi:hypothetical protein